MDRNQLRNEIRNSNRLSELRIFNEILHQQSFTRGIVFHSNGEGRTGKTTLLKMFERFCKASDFPCSTLALFFTANNPLDWQIILDKSVEFLGLENFVTYTQTRDANQALGKQQTDKASDTRHITNIQTVYGQVHTGSGDIEFSNEIDRLEEIVKPEGESSLSNNSFIVKTPEELCVSLTDIFFRELKNLNKSFQLVWLIDATEKLDETTAEWLYRIFNEIYEGKLDDLVLVVAGRKQLCYEPFWVERIEELEVGNFSFETVLEIVQTVWPENDISSQQLTATLLMEKSGGRPLEIISEIERFAPHIKG